MVCSPERHTLLMVLAGTDRGIPRLDGGLAGRDLALAGLEDLAHEDVVHLVGGRPRPAFRASAMANPPSSMAVKPPSAPDSLPMGVRAPATMTASAMTTTSESLPAKLPVGNHILRANYRRGT